MVGCHQKGQKARAADNSDNSYEDVMRLHVSRASNPRIAARPALGTQSSDQSHYRSAAATADIMCKRRLTRITRITGGLATNQKRELAAVLHHDFSVVARAEAGCKLKGWGGMASRRGLH